MQSYKVTSVLSGCEWLDRRVSASAGTVGSAVSVALRPFAVLPFDDPLPEPEPPPPYPGDEPPIEYPVLPPSGPAGPGS